MTRQHAVSAEEREIRSVLGTTLAKGIGKEPVCEETAACSPDAQQDSDRVEDRVTFGTRLFMAELVTKNNGE